MSIPGDLVIRRADGSDLATLATIDPIAAAGSAQRLAHIRIWCEQGWAIVATTRGDSLGRRLLGYVVLNYTFFDQGFVRMLMVAPDARRQGVGARLLEEAVAACTTDKLFTSTNVSNLPMQSLLARLGWRAVGLVHGLDENDPELFFCHR